jgi:hypothetical protein
MKKIILTAFFGYLAVLLVGMLFYRLMIFDTHVHYFQFVELGFIGAVLYPLFLYRGRKEVFLAFALILVFHFVLFKPERAAFIIRDIIIISSLFVTIMIYAHYLLPRIVKKYKILRVFALALLYAAVNAAGLLLLMVTMFLFYDKGWQDFPAHLLLYVKYGFMIGFGLSVGFNFAEFSIDKMIAERS